MASFSSSETDWAWLPKDLVGLIVDKLILLSDFVRFGAVCKPWRSVALDKKQKRNEARFKQPPMLLVPNGHGSGRLYSVSEEKTYNCQLAVPFTKKCPGSSFGWLVKAEDDMAITLINPFSGDQFWTYLVRNLCPKAMNDAYFYKGQLYLLGGFNELVKVDINDSDSDSDSDSYDVPNYEIIVSPSLEFSSHKSYLVEASNGDLLLIQRIHFFDGNITNFGKTVYFEVYRLTKHSTEGQKQGKWVEIDSMGDDAVFLGDEAFAYWLLIFPIANQIPYVTLMIVWRDLIFHCMNPVTWGSSIYKS
ncbi:uncharacterized protein LOC132314503 [Cornus florida]|uniref:uncharacterized protein LOC132314503 n=1 Tax=Cornus florida TaxID=4283 RepID=UPI002898D897|nr:uncharacterized protein LOC132314503 [Cornus florida]